MVRLSLAVIFCFFLVVWTECLADGEGGSVEMAIGGVRLAIPSRYVLPGFPSTIVPEGGGLDEEENGVSLEIPLGDLKVDFEGGGVTVNKVVVLVSGAWGEGGVQLSPAAIDAWRGEGLYRESVVEFDSEVNLYRIYPRAGYPVIWQYFRSSPSEGGDAVKNWVASCMASPGADGGIGLANTRCKFISLCGTVRSELTLFGAGIRLMDVVLREYKKMVVHWAQEAKAASVGLRELGLSETPL